MKNREVAVIIPAYNETPVIGGVIDKVARHFQHIICVDDGSTDDSANEIAKTSATLIKHHINLGQGAALQTGIDFALLNKDIQYFVTYDADGQHDVKDALFMLETIKKTGVDIVLGSRFLGKAENITWLKRKILRLAVLFSNKTSGVQLSDAHNGLRVFNRKVAAELKITMPDFSHASEIVERIVEKQFSYREVPITVVYSEYSRKKGQSIFNAINIGFDVLLNKITKR